MVLDTQLSAHFRLSEFTLSGIAERRGIANVPNDFQLENLQRLAMVLERARSRLDNAPLLISSGFRSAEVNALVGGARLSAHLDGRAADFIAPSFGTPADVCKRLVASTVEFDQVIFEGAWVHLAIPIGREEPRRQVLTAIFERGSPVRYVRGVVHG
ncbi:D-Ala-D-Ala carboxypeptidase family metallohydrolase [Variovorax gossypii]